MEVITDQFYTGTIGPKGVYNYCNIGGINVHRIYASIYELKKAVEEQREDHNIVLADKFVVDDDDITNSFRILNALDEPEDNSESKFKDCNPLEISPAYSLYNFDTRKLTSPPGTMTWFCKTKKTAHKWKIKCNNKSNLCVVRLDSVIKLIDASNPYTLEDIVNTKHILMIDELGVDYSPFLKSYDLEKFDLVKAIENQDIVYVAEYKLDRVRKHIKEILKNGIVKDVMYTRDPYSGERQECIMYIMNLTVKGNKFKFIKDLNN